MTAPAAAVADTDTRILIDVSGSMKRTDPRNLRAPAVRLIAGLLPSGSLAGVWTFGRSVNMEVAHGSVDAAWRERAHAGAARIHSRGLFTNIEQAVRHAMRGWRGPPGELTRNLILLTDGVVDVAKDAALSEASRRRLLQELLPQLQQRGIRVMTVALSAQADQELLAALAQSTGGWFEAAADADALQRAFLHAFDQATQADSVPLNGNAFRVDGSISELTLLVLRAPGAAPTRLGTPAGEELAADSAPGTVNWLAEEGYDLVTVQNPAPGEWQVQAELDPDNRVLVVTDLSLRSERPASHLLPADSLALEAALHEAGATIARPDFLQLVKVVAEHQRPDGRVDVYPMLHDASGVFRAEIPDLHDEGEHHVVISASSDTFSREQQHRFKVAMPARVAVGEAAQGFPLQVLPRPEFIGADGFEVSATLAGGGTVARPVPLAPGDAGAWLGSLGELEPGQYRLALVLRGTAPTGRRVTLELPDIAVHAPAPELPAAAPAAVPEDAMAGISWGTLAWQLGAVNLLAALGAGAVLWWRRRDRRDRSLQLTEVES